MGEPVKTRQGAEVRSRPGRLRRLEPWFYLAPALIWFAALAIYPIIYTVNVSLRDWSNAAHPLVGLSHYAQMLSDSGLIATVRATALYSVGTLLLSFVLGFAIALILASDDVYSKALFRGVLILPYVISPVVVGIDFRLMLHPTLGIFNYVLGTPGRDWLGSPQWAMPTLILITSWEHTPFFAIILLAGLLGLPRDPYDAARIDGADGIRLFRYLTLPLLRPVSQVALVIGLVDVIKAFAVVYTTTQGGPANLTQIIGLYVYHVGFEYYDLGYAAALAVVLLLVIAVIAFLTMRAFSEQRVVE